MTETILQIMREASRSILDIYADEDRFHTELKADDSPLTAADQASNTIICKALQDFFPGIPVISEETKQALYDERKAYQAYFLVDPLDGTKEFIKRNGEFTVNIAYLEGEHPVGGFVYVPCTELGYVASYGEGAFCIQSDGTAHALHTKPFHLMDQGLSVVASRSHLDSRTERIIHSLNAPKLVSTGSSLKFLKIAEGHAHFYPRLAPTMEWDTAAAQCILEEAGGAVVQYDSLLPLVYNKPNLMNPHFIAMGALLDPESLPGVVHRV